VSAHRGLGIEVDDAAGCVREDPGDRFWRDIQAVLSRDWVKREPAESFAVHDHKIGPVDSTGLVEQHNVREGYIPKSIGKKAFDESYISRKRGPDVMRRQQRYLS
jgi:hypothetical protein